MQRRGALLRQFMRALADNLAGERERWALWFPVAMGAGVGFYFWLPAEPSLVLGLAMLAGSAGLLGLIRRRPVLRFLVLGLFAAVLGFAAAEVRTAVVAAPMLADEVKGVQVRGRVREVEFLPTGRRIRLDQVTLEGVDPAPAQVRLKLGLDYPIIPNRTTCRKALRHRHFLRFLAGGIAPPATATNYDTLPSFSNEIRAPYRIATAAPCGKDCDKGKGPDSVKRRKALADIGPS